MKKEFVKDSQGEDIFIDADEPYYETHTFEELIMRQFQVCVNNLSKELTGGVIKSRLTKQGQQEGYVEDVRAAVINSVDTLRRLMRPFTKPDDVKVMEKIDKDIADFQNKLGEIKIPMKGQGMIKIKDLKQLSAEHPIYKELMEYKTERHREIFSILVKIYHKDKQEIAEFSRE
jgi:hypothetical protein